MLARVQAELFAARAKALGTQVDLHFFSTKGDELFSKKISDLGPQAFTKELDDALLHGEIDLAVHSLKDVEIELPKGLEIACVFGRKDARDCLVSWEGKTLSQLPSGASVGCSSARRVFELARLRRDVVAKSIRGNVPTRVSKVGGEFDAVVLAVAGLQRLGGLESKISQIFSIDEMVPAAGQGALAVLCREGENFGLDSGENFEECFLEREFARGLGACRNPVGAFCEKRGNGFALTGLAYKGEKRFVPKFEGTKGQVFGQLNEWKESFLGS